MAKEPGRADQTLDGIVPQDDQIAEIKSSFELYRKYAELLEGARQVVDGMEGQFFANLTKNNTNFEWYGNLLEKGMQKIKREIECHSLTLIQVVPNLPEPDGKELSQELYNWYIQLKKNLGIIT